VEHDRGRGILFAVDSGSSCVSSSNDNCIVATGSSSYTYQEHCLVDYHIYHGRGTWLCAASGKGGRWSSSCIGGDGDCERAADRVPLVPCTLYVRFIIIIIIIIII